MMAREQSGGRIFINPVRVTIFLLSVAILLIVTHVVGLIFRFEFGHESVFGLVPLFDLNVEANVPTYFSSLLSTFTPYLHSNEYLDTTRPNWIFCHQ